jgi:hypothetical protein
MVPQNRCAQDQKERRLGHPRREFPETHEFGTDRTEIFHPYRKYQLQGKQVSRGGYLRLLVLTPANYLGRDSRDNCMGRNILSDDSAGTNYGAITNLYSRQYDRIGSNPDVISYCNFLVNHRLFQDSFSSIMFVLV